MFLTLGSGHCLLFDFGSYLIDGYRLWSGVSKCLRRCSCKWFLVNYLRIITCFLCFCWSLFFFSLSFFWELFVVLIQKQCVCRECVKQVSNGYRSIKSLFTVVEVFYLSIKTLLSYLNEQIKYAYNENPKCSFHSRST